MSVKWPHQWRKVRCSEHGYVRRIQQCPDHDPMCIYCHPDCYPCRNIRLAQAVHSWEQERWRAPEPCAECDSLLPVWRGCLGCDARAVEEALSAAIAPPLEPRPIFDCSQCGKIKPIGGCWECVESRWEGQTASALGRGRDLT